MFNDNPRASEAFPPGMGAAHDGDFSELGPIEQRKEPRGCSILGYVILVVGFAYCLGWGCAGFHAMHEANTARLSHSGPYSEAGVMDGASEVGR